MVKVSVLLITYNHEKYIRTCLDSIVSQKTNFPFEILVHDDASADGTQEIIKEYQKKYSNIQAVLQTENQFSLGRTHPDEPLLPLINGEYVCMVEGDDYWCDERKLQRQFDALEAYQGCSMCVHKTKCVDQDDNDLNVIIGEWNFNNGIIGKTDIFKTFFIDNYWAFQTSSYFVRSSILIDRPEFWNKFYVGDLPMILWFAHKGDFYFINETMSCYRMFSEGSATNLNRIKEYAVKKARTNADGLIAFNEYTQKTYWPLIKHITSFYLYQYFAATGDKLSPEYLTAAKDELSLTEKITARIKYTQIGYLIRNLREDMNKKQMRRKG